MSPLALGALALLGIGAVVVVVEVVRSRNNVQQQLANATKKAVTDGVKGALSDGVRGLLPQNPAGGNTLTQVGGVIKGAGDLLGSVGKLLGGSSGSGTAYGTDLSGGAQAELASGSRGNPVVISDATAGTYNIDLPSGASGGGGGTSGGDTFAGTDPFAAGYTGEG